MSSRIATRERREPSTKSHSPWPPSSRVGRAMTKMIRNLGTLVWAGLLLAGCSAGDTADNGTGGAGGTSAAAAGGTAAGGKGEGVTGGSAAQASLDLVAEMISEAPSAIRCCSA